MKAFCSSAVQGVLCDGKCFPLLDVRRDEDFAFEFEFVFSPLGTRPSLSLLLFEDGTLASVSEVVMGECLLLAEAGVD